jgi:hypothetical protein
VTDKRPTKAYKNCFRLVNQSWVRFMWNYPDAWYIRAQKGWTCVDLDLNISTLEPSPIYSLSPFLGTVTKPPLILFEHPHLMVKIPWYLVFHYYPHVMVKIPLIVPLIIPLIVPLLIPLNIHLTSAWLLGLPRYALRWAQTYHAEEWAFGSATLKRMLKTKLWKLWDLWMV